MNKTEINWTDLSWNPASGCTKISTECKYCYAHTIAENKRGTRAFPNGFDITLRPWKLDEPERTRAASLIFTNSMTDMFHESISDAYRDQCFAAMTRAPWHRYQVLTKRPEAAERYFSGRAVPSWVWLGCTVGHTDSIGRIDVLRRIDASVRFLSCEPLVGHLDLSGHLDGIHWVIGGGESGSHLSDPATMEIRGMVERGNKDRQRWVARPDRYHWARDLRDSCVEQRVAFWWKQWGGPTPKGGGREIDGRTWDEMPTSPGCMPDASLAPESGTRFAQPKRHRRDYVHSASPPLRRR